MLLRNMDVWMWMLPTNSNTDDVYSQHSFKHTHTHTPPFFFSHIPIWRNHEEKEAKGWFQNGLSESSFYLNKHLISLWGNQSSLVLKLPCWWKPNVRKYFTLTRKWGLMWSKREIGSGIKAVFPFRRTLTHSQDTTKLQLPPPLHRQGYYIPLYISNTALLKKRLCDSSCASTKFNSNRNKCSN